MDLRFYIYIICLIFCLAYTFGRIGFRNIPNAIGDKYFWLEIAFIVFVPPLATLIIFISIFFGDKIFEKEE